MRRVEQLPIVIAITFRRMSHVEAEFLKVAILGHDDEAVRGREVPYPEIRCGTEACCGHVQGVRIEIREHYCQAR